MDNNDLLTLLIAFVLGYFAHQMMGQMCGGRLVEGKQCTANTVRKDCNRYERCDIHEYGEDGQKGIGTCTLI